MDQPEVDEDLDEDILASRAKKRTTAFEKVKSTLARRWTHNEQLVVKCCGVIISRATFYNSEGMSNVLVSLFTSRVVLKHR